MSRSPRTVTQTSTTAPPSWLQTQQQDFLGRANALSQQEYQPYTGQLVQGLTGDQQQARQMLRERIESGGSPAMRQGREVLNGIIGGSGYRAPAMNPFMGRTASFDPDANEFMGQSVGVGRNSYLGRETDVARNRFLDENNPFLQEVIDNTTGDVTRAFNLQQAPQQLAQFAMGGAFGGSAHLQAMGESQRALAQELGRTASGLRSDDFNARRQLAESEADRITNTRLADVGRNSGLEQDSISLQAQLADSALSRNAQLRQRSLEFGADLEDRGIARNAGLAQDWLGMDQNAWQFGQNRQLQALGMLPGYEDAGIRDIQALNAMGGEERDYMQQLLASQYGQFLDRRDWDAQRLGIYGNALGQVAPNYQNSTQTGANPNYQSRGQQILGGGLALAGLGI